jgi:sugar phosphate isomerase/epimerase
VLYGAPVSTVERVTELRELGFDFAEVVLASATSRRRWWESGIKNDFGDGFFLAAHGPVVDDTYDAVHLKNHYLPTLKATVDAARRMNIRLLTIHFSVDSRWVNRVLLAEKKTALAMLISYGRANDVTVCLENVTESAADIEDVLQSVPGLCLTLDVGHGQLYRTPNTAFDLIRRCGRAIRHVHLHDNRGGLQTSDDLHLPIGDGVINFPVILAELAAAGYDGTVSLEVKKEGLVGSRERVREMMEGIRSGR